MSAFRIFIPYFRKYWFLLTVGFSFLLIQNYALTLIPKYVKLAMNEVTRDNRIDFLNRYLTLILVFTFVACLTMFLMRKCIISVSRYIEYELRGRLFNKLMHLDYRFYMKNQTGDLISRCTHDLDDVRTLLGPGIMYVPNALTRFAFFSPVLFGISSKLLGIIFINVGVIVAVILIFLPRLRPFYRAIQEKMGEVNSRVWQIISGIAIIKYYRREPNEIERFEKLNEEYVSIQMRLVKWRGFLWPFFLFAVSCNQFILLMWGGQEIIAGTMNVGELMQYIIMVTALTFPVLSLGWVMSLIQQGITAMERLRHIFDQPEESTGQITFVGEQKLQFEFRGLAYTYPEAPAPALRIDRWTLPVSGIIGLTGPVGSGKSTFINLLAGILKPDHNQIFINGADIRDFDADDYRLQVAVVPQENFLFSKTIHKNIALSSRSNGDLDAVVSVSKLAQLHGDILQMPDRYEQMVGERGITLSGGQKQRTSIARALFKHKRIILLDDALSSVDAEVESAILADLLRIAGDKLILLISNRVSALRITDHIVVFERGEISQSGSHRQLLQEEGYYARMAMLQKMEREVAAWA